MWNKQIILILCILWIGGSTAKSFRPTSFDYDYREDSRKSSNNYRVNSAATTTPRPSFQKYWDNFVSNIPTLPPTLRWNMTNSLSNLFNNGAQEIIETPVSFDQMEVEEPNRRRKSSKRTKKNKNHRRAQSGDQRNYYNYHTPSYQQNSVYQQTNGYQLNSGYQQNNGYQQMQLQPLGVDQSNVMHFYEPNTGKYFALQMESQPPQNHFNHNRYNSYYNNHAGYSYNTNDNDEDEEDEDYYHDENNHANDYDTENMEYDNEYNNDAEYDVEGDEHHYDHNDDNWGYNDDEVFGDRKLKGSYNVIKPLLGVTEVTENDNNIIKIQKHSLKPESEDDVMLLLSDNDEQTNAKKFKPSSVNETNDKKTSTKRLKPTATEETSEDMEEESVRNLLGSFMKDDLANRRRQTANTKQSSHLVEKPRHNEGYYIFPANFWLN